MALFTISVRLALSTIFDAVDDQVRDDFSKGFIRDENDYTSNLTSRVRNLINSSLNLHATTHTQMLPKKVEEAWGVDACIIFIDHANDLSKLCLFEAKSDGRWDRIQKKIGFRESHFSTQLDRQRKPFNMGFAIWEQFYSRKPCGSPIGRRNTRGSTCILHQEAILHNAPHPGGSVWNLGDIDLLAVKQGSTKMGDMILKACECKIGTPKTLQELYSLIGYILPAKHILVIQGGGKVISHEEYFNKKADLKNNIPIPGSCD
ncbi:hypothetical protein [Aeromonas veronii]|uniref:hypothetical protein n=1 Tax=Aeromonas veronii TaxID=654 RepID=UPI003BA0D87B